MIQFSNISCDLFPFHQLFEQIGGIDTLERLQEHENEEVYKQVHAMLETYFAEVSVS